MSALLEVRGLGLRFGNVTALDGIDLAVHERELLAVIGPNGAGKSSLYNCISGLYRPQQGSITLAGADLLALAPHQIAAAGVGRVFQNLALFDNLSTLDNLMLGRHPRMGSRWWADWLGLPGALANEAEHRAAVEEVIDFLHLARWRDYPVGLLPYGVRKRIELGRALCMAPRLLLLDEPAAGLNQEETEDLAAYLLDLRAERDITIVLIEHELGFVMDLADRVAVLDFGRLIACGAPQEVRQNPEVIAAYIGGAPDDGDPGAAAQENPA